MSTEPQPATQAPQPDAPPLQSDTMPPPQHAGPPPQHHPIKRTRLRGLWIALIIFAVVLLFLLIFILQNNRGVDVSYLGAHGHMPLGVALLMAAVCGALLAILAAVARIAQLNSAARKHRRADAKR